MEDFLLRCSAAHADTPTPFALLLFSLLLPETVTPPAPPPSSAAAIVVCCSALLSQLSLPPHHSSNVVRPSQTQPSFLSFASSSPSHFRLLSPPLNPALWRHSYPPAVALLSSPLLSSTTVPFPLPLLPPSHCRSHPLSDSTSALYPSMSIAGYTAQSLPFLPPPAAAPSLPPVGTPLRPPLSGGPSPPHSPLFLTAAAPPGPLPLLLPLPLLPSCPTCFFSLCSTAGLAH